MFGWRQRMLRVLLLALAVLTAGAQTQIDLRTQAKSVDFTAATSTKPMKAGTVLPATCAVGEMFFNTGATAGSNVYACTTTNTWTAQGSGASGCTGCVTSVFGRAGVVGAQSGDYSFGQISGTASPSQLPGVAMRTDQSNTVSGGTQDFRA